MSALAQIGRLYLEHRVKSIFGSLCKRIDLKEDGPNNATIVVISAHKGFKGEEGAVAILLSPLELESLFPLELIDSRIYNAYTAMRRVDENAV
jgi:hypothetical protein